MEITNRIRKAITRRLMSAETFRRLAELMGWRPYPGTVYVFVWGIKTNELMFYTCIGNQTTVEYAGGRLKVGMVDFDTAGRYTHIGMVRAPKPEDLEDDTGRALLDAVVNTQAPAWMEEG